MGGAVEPATSECHPFGKTHARSFIAVGHKPGRTYARIRGASQPHRVNCVSPRLREPYNVSGR
ncbi:dual specificity phosphatase [Rhodovulum sulfidophilum]|uniref:Dual specificity phosphatase n=1 Tax=Rhodovulum sulfidophilum TaxID=35806 RepID=A0A0D6AXQ1_RHOSU|nr:dual specificity phosphatase [Rhodovulum sulfidophilum]